MIKLVTVVILHLIVIAGNTASFVILPFAVPLYVAFPCCSIIFYLALSRSARCPLTDIENKYRQELGMPQIKGFIGHYLLRRKKI